MLGHDFYVGKGKLQQPQCLSASMFVGPKILVEMISSPVHLQEVLPKTQSTKQTGGETVLEGRMVAVGSPWLFDHGRFNAIMVASKSLTVNEIDIGVNLQLIQLEYEV